MEHRAGAEAVHRTAPIRACPQIDGVVISVCEAEPKQDAARCVQPQRIDELLSHEAHRGRAEDDDALLVQPNDALIRPKIEQFGEVQRGAVAAYRRGVSGTSPYLPLYGVNSPPLRIVEPLTDHRNEPQGGSSACTTGRSRLRCPRYVDQVRRLVVIRLARHGTGDCGPPGEFLARAGRCPGSTPGIARRKTSGQHVINRLSCLTGTKHSQLSNAALLNPGVRRVSPKVAPHASSPIEEQHEERGYDCRR